jgi:uncharacterized beta barrel domain-containing protein DUF5777
LLCATAAFAQDPAPPAPAPATAPDDAVLRLEEPDYTIIALPTSLRLPEFKSAFRVTHRFTRPLSCDTCPNSLAGDGFGIDSGAQIGLEYRFGVFRNTQISVDRTSDKTVELSAQYGVMRQNERSPIEASLLAAVDVTNVGRRGTDSQYSPILGAILTRLVGDQAALYVEPMWLHHTNLFQPTISDNDTFMVGLGARIRIRPTVYVTGEFSPRVAGYKPGSHQGSFAIEKRAGGHMFQLNFSNAFGTQLSQLAQGAPSGTTNWYMGFNITRKFY